MLPLMTLRVGDPLPPELAAVEVLDDAGRASPLGERFTDGPAALVFLRHFACLACTEHVTQLAPRLHELTRLGLRVTYVGNGESRYIEGFVERNAVDPCVVAVVTDPSLAAHRALALPRSVLSAYGPRALFGLARAFVSGFRQRAFEGDHLQQGGVLVIDREGRVAYLHRDQATGDHAPTNDVIEAAMRVAATGQPIA